MNLNNKTNQKTTSTTNETTVEHIETNKQEKFDEAFYAKEYGSPAELVNFLTKHNIQLNRAENLSLKLCKKIHIEIKEHFNCNFLIMFEIIICGLVQQGESARSCNGNINVKFENSKSANLATVHTIFKSRGLRLRKYVCTKADRMFIIAKRNDFSGNLYTKLQRMFPKYKWG